MNLYFQKCYSLIVEDYTDKPLCIVNHVLLALAVCLAQLQRKFLSNLNYLFIYNKLDHQYYKLCDCRLKLSLRLALF